MARPAEACSSTGPPPTACSSPYSATAAMKAGSTMTSRDSHEVRHCAAERQARSGRERWKNEATSPATSSASAITLPVT